MRKTIDRGLNYIRGSKFRILIVEIILVFLTARLFVYTGYVRYSPEREAEAFAVKILNADYGRIYRELDVSDNKDGFLNKENFIKANQKVPVADFVDCYTKKSFVKSGLIQKFLIGEAVKNKEGVSVNVPVYFKDAQEGVYEENIRMKLRDSKKFFLFHNWKVDLSDYIVNDFEITVLEGASVKINGEKLSSEYLRNKEYGNESYVIPLIFKGNYDIAVSKVGMEDLTMSVNTADGYCSAVSMKIKPEIMQKAVSQAAEDMKKLYTSAFEKNEDAFHKIDMMSETENEIRNSYLDLLEQIQSSHKINLLVGKIQPDVYYYNENGSIFIEVNFNYDYSGLYEYEYWGGEKTTRDYKGNNSSTFTYLLNDSDLQLSSFSGLTL